MEYRRGKKNVLFIGRWGGKDVKRIHNQLRKKSERTEKRRIIYRRESTWKRFGMSTARRRGGSGGRLSVNISVE